MTNVVTDMNIELVDISDLRVDERAQRAMNKPHAQKLASGFDYRKVGALIISEREDGQRYILDGQHRVSGGQASGYTGKLPAVVHRGLSLAAEAELFLALNENKPVPVLEKFKTRVVAGDRAAVTINKIIEDAGFRIGVGRYGADHSIAAVSAVEWVYRNGGGAVLRDYLRIVNEAWPTPTTPAKSSRFIKAMGAVLSRPGVDPDRLLSQLAKTTASTVLADGDFAAEMSTSITKARADVAVLLKLYNKGLKSAERIEID